METPCQLQIVRLFTTCCWWLGVSEKLQRNTTKLGVSEKTQQQLKSFSLKITSKKKKKAEEKKESGDEKKKRKICPPRRSARWTIWPTYSSQMLQEPQPTPLLFPRGSRPTHTHTRMALFDPVTFYRMASRIKWAWYNDLVYEVRRLPGKKTMQLPLSNCLWVLIQEWVNVKL